MAFLSLSDTNLATQILDLIVTAGDGTLAVESIHSMLAKRSIKATNKQLAEVLNILNNSSQICLSHFDWNWTTPLVTYVRVP